MLVLRLLRATTVAKTCKHGGLARRVTASLILGLAFACVTAGQTGLTPIQREIERQRQRLSSSEVEERRDALMRLSHIRRAEAGRLAAASLNDPAPVVRVTAAHAIVSLPSSEAVSLLAPLLKDKVEFVRQEVAHVLGQTRDRAAVTPLVEVLASDKKPSVRGAAAVALGQIGEESAAVPLAQALTGSDPRRENKKPGDDFVMRAAARSLGQIHSRAAIPALAAALDNPKNPSDVRREAAIALGLIGDPSALPSLQSAFSSAEDPYLSEATRVAIRKISRSKN